MILGNEYGGVSYCSRRCCLTQINFDLVQFMAWRKSSLNTIFPVINSVSCGSNYKLTSCCFQDTSTPPDTVYLPLVSPLTPIPLRHFSQFMFCTLLSSPVEKRTPFLLKVFPHLVLWTWWWGVLFRSQNSGSPAGIQLGWDQATGGQSIWFPLYSYSRCSAASSYVSTLHNFHLPCMSSFWL